MTLEPLAILTATQLEHLIVAAVRKATGREPGLVSQRESPLGRIRHGNAVRRRIAEGEPGAFHVGRDYLLTPEALREELERLSSEPADTAAANDTDADRIRAELEAKLRLVRDKRRK